MPNPWTDPEKTRVWTPDGKPGNALRPLQIGLILTTAAVCKPQRILDVGCGHGEIDARLLEHLPDAEIVCLDESAVMLERAAERLAPFGSRARFVQAGIESDWRDAVAPPFDLILASQAVHHVVAKGKRAFYARAFDALKVGGLLLLNDKVAFAPAFFPYMVGLWNGIRSAAGYEPVAATLEYAPWKEAEILGGDVPDTVDKHLTWLGDAGFEPVDCLWRHGNQALIAALKNAS